MEVFSLVLIIVWAGLGIAMLVTGVIYKDKTVAYLPAQLVSGGGVALLEMLAVSLLVLARNWRRDNGYLFPMFLLGLLTLLLLTILLFSNPAFWKTDDILRLILLYHIQAVVAFLACLGLLVSLLHVLDLVTGEQLEEATV